MLQFSLLADRLVYLLPQLVIYCTFFRMVFKPRVNLLQSAVGVCAGGANMILRWKRERWTFPSGKKRQFLKTQHCHCVAIWSKFRSLFGAHCRHLLIFRCTKFPCDVIYGPVTKDYFVFQFISQVFSKLLINCLV